MSHALPYIALFASPFLFACVVALLAMVADKVTDEKS